VVLMRRFSTLAAVAALLLLPAAGFSQRLLEIGFKGGVPMNDTIRGAEDRSVPFTFGGMANLNLPLGFAVEGNALYKRVGYRLDLANADAFESRTGAWEFPILLKSYPLGRNPLLQPFLSAGLNFRSVRLDTPGMASERARSTGLVFAAGIRNGPGRIKVAPEFRYTRWGDSQVLMPIPGAGGPRLNANQLEFLVGLTF
jgi:hypothetical protein